MNVAIKVKDDGGQLRAEAAVNSGKVFESLGMFAEALEQMEYCYELTDENEIWFVRDNSEVTVHHDACVHLHRVYTKLAISALDDGNPEESVNYYLKAYNAAREGTVQS